MYIELQHCLTLSANPNFFWEILVHIQYPSPCHRLCRTDTYVRWSSINQKAGNYILVFNVITHVHLLAQLQASHLSFLITWVLETLLYHPSSMLWGRSSKFVLFFHPRALSRWIALRPNPSVSFTGCQILHHLANCENSILSAYICLSPAERTISSPFDFDWKGPGGAIPKSELMLQICKIRAGLPLSVLWCDWAGWACSLRGAASACAPRLASELEWMERNLFSWIDNSW